MTGILADFFREGAMSNRRFEMFEIRTVLVRLRRGDSDRAIARAGLMGRNKLRRFRVLADRHGWLDPANPLPDPGSSTRIPVNCARRGSS